LPPWQILINDNWIPKQNPMTASIIALRPQKLAELIGQDQVKENLGIFIAAARGRGEALDHVLFYGPPGLGKNHSGACRCQRNGCEYKSDLRPAIERAGDLAAILTNLRAGDVLFMTRSIV